MDMDDVRLPNPQQLSKRPPSMDRPNCCRNQYKLLGSDVGIDFPITSVVEDDFVSSAQQKLMLTIPVAHGVACKVQCIICQPEKRE